MGVTRTIHTKVVGVTKLNDEESRIQSLLKEMDASASDGDLLDLEHEADNPYDVNAIKVFHYGDHIGYIKRELAAEIVEAVDGDRVEARVEEITGGGDVSFGCNIIINIFDSTDDTPPPTSKAPHQATDLQISKLKAKATMFIPAVSLSLLWGGIAILALVIKELLFGLVSVVVTGLLALWAINCRMARYDLEDLDAEDVAKKAQKTGTKISVGILFVVVLLVGAYCFVNRSLGASKANQLDTKAVATAQIALDQFAPGTNYGPVAADGWTVIHNKDGTTTVWAPNAYGRIVVMMTDDGEAYTPYYIAVDGEVKLGK